MDRYSPQRPAKKAKAPDPWIAWNLAHPELVCTEVACPHNKQTIERRRTRRTYAEAQIATRPTS